MLPSKDRVRLLFRWSDLRLVIAGWRDAIEDLEKRKADEPSGHQTVSPTDHNRDCSSLIPAGHVSWTSSDPDRLKGQWSRHVVARKAPHITREVVNQKQMTADNGGPS